MKLFGTTRSGARLAKNMARSRTSHGAAAVQAPQKKQRNPLKALAIILLILLALELCYFYCIYTSNAFVSQWRTIYIETAMDTLNHKWLANAIIPRNIIAQVMDSRNQSLAEMEGLESTWGDLQPEQNPEAPPAMQEEESQENEQIEITVIPEEEQADPQEAAREAFYQLFHELDVESMDAFAAEHPEVLVNGWEGIRINKAGQDYEGIDVYTTQGERVLAIDAPNKLLLLQVEGGGLDFYQGVLAICKDNTRLSLEISSKLGTAGEYAGTIASANGGILAISGSGYDDPDGNGNGGIVAGFSMSNGEIYSTAHMGWGFKRLELHEDNLFYIKDANSQHAEGTTDAMEFQPALIIDGEIVVDANCGWTGLHPRSVIGQNDKFEILMLVIEGRMPTRSVGTHVIECAEILKRYGCMQAMNMDGGTSAIMWYDGEYITKCNNANLPSGRPMPNAWVYSPAERKE